MKSTLNRRLSLMLFLIFTGLTPLPLQANNFIGRNFSWDCRSLVTLGENNPQTNPPNAPNETDERTRTLQEHLARLESRVTELQGAIHTRSELDLARKERRAQRRREEAQARVEWLRLSANNEIENMTASNKKEAALRAIDSFNEYFGAVRSAILERDFAIEPIMILLLSREHGILIGPPGNAKSKLIEIILRNILEEWLHPITGKLDYRPSFMRIQMTKETALSHTHGSPNFRTLQRTGRMSRFIDEGILGHRLVLADEFGDLNPNAFRNPLEALFERTHSEGGTTYQGILWTCLAATNKTLAEIYAEQEGKSDPQAVFDRFAQMILVPRDLEFVGSYNAIVNGVGTGRAVLPRFTFRQLQALQQLVPLVEIPNHVNYLLSLFQYRFGPQTRGLEEAARNEYEQKRQRGENPIPYYRATKYDSIRTLSGAAKFLRAFVVRRWIGARGEHPLVASTEDLPVLQSFYTMGGATDAFLQMEFDRSSDPKSQAQIKYLLKERDMFQKTLDGIVGEFEQVIQGFSTRDVALMVRDYNNMDESEKSRLIETLEKIFRETNVGSLDRFPMQNLTPTIVAHSALNESVVEWLRSIVGDSRANSLLQQWIASPQPTQPQNQPQATP